MTDRISPARPTLRSRVLPAVRIALPAWVIARALVTVAYLTARYLERHGHLHDALAHTTVRQGLLAWDGAFYADIAQHGYAALPQPALRFFPLTPLLGRAVGWIGVGPRVGVVIVANLAALAAGTLLVLLVRSEGFAPGVARRSAWILALAPSAFVLVLGYAEAVFLVLAIGIFLAARRRHWWVVIALGVLAGLSRPSGFVVAVPVAIEAVRAWRSAPVAERVRAAIAVVAPFVGTAAFLAWVDHVFGDGLLPFRVQTRANLKGAFTDPVSSISDAVSGMFHGHIGTGLHVPWMIVVVVLVVLAFRRLPASYGAFAVAAVASAVTSANLDSFERYALGAFPILIVAALLLTDRRWAIAAITASSLAMTAYATLAFAHAYVP
jgi:hypothetical protein